MDQQTLLDAIANGFRKTPREAFISAGIISAVVLLFFLISIIYQSIIKGKNEKNWNSEFDKLVREKDLTINELDLIDEMALYLIDSRRKILLVKNRNTFHIALSKLDKNKKPDSDFVQNMIKKLFDEKDLQKIQNFDDHFGSGRPARLCLTNGHVYTGHVLIRNEKFYTIDKVKKIKNQNEKPENRLFIQDFKGIIVQPISEVKKLPDMSLKLYTKTEIIKKPVKVSIGDVYVFPIGNMKPIETNMLLLPNGTGVIENPQGILKTGHAIKLSLEENTNAQFRMNCLVIGLNFNKRYAKVKFGYVKT